MPDPTPAFLVLSVEYDDDNSWEVRNDKIFPWFEKLGWESFGQENDQWRVPDDWCDRVEHEIEVTNNEQGTHLRAVWGDKVYAHTAYVVSKTPLSPAAIENLATRASGILRGSGPYEVQIDSACRVHSAEEFSVEHWFDKEKTS